ncbi:MAG: helix-hairpin-helix domain-containing protein [Deltaproteobacteria bacterium]|nr:helix-hairpin-helix domain-containing protein [Deltaproteobacteria bacterium]
MRPIGGWQGLLLGTPLELNRATADDLTALPGIGPKKASAVLAFREENGPFRETGDLLQVPGIGPNTLERLASLLRVEAPAAVPLPR